MTVAAIIQTVSPSLQAIDLGLLYLILWLSGTSFLSLSCFLAALSSSASMTTSLYSAQFLIALITVAACSSTYNHYVSVGYSDGVINDSVCYLVSSSYNTVYSSSLLGNQFVMFLVFFLPWFHAAQAMSDVLSAVQFEGQTIGMGGIAQSITLSYSASPGTTFPCPWIQYSLVMLISTSIL